MKSNGENILSSTYSDGTDVYFNNFDTYLNKWSFYLFSIDFSNANFKMATLAVDDITPLKVIGNLKTSRTMNFSGFINAGIYIDEVPAYYPSCS